MLRLSLIQANFAEDVRNKGIIDGNQQIPPLCREADEFATCNDHSYAQAKEPDGVCRPY